MGSFERGKEIEKDAFRLVTSVGQRKNFWAPGPDSIPHGNSEIFTLSHARDKTKNIFLCISWVAQISRTFQNL